MYAADNKGQLPPDLAALMLHSPKTVNRTLFICPTSTDTPAPGATWQQQATTLLAQPGHCSYIYTGAGLTTKTATAKTIILYEPLANHGKTMNVAYGDGHVATLQAAEAAYVITELKAGFNPPRPQPPTPVRSTPAPAISPR